MSTVLKTPVVPISIETVSWLLEVRIIWIVSAWVPVGRVVWPG